MSAEGEKREEGDGDAVASWLKRGEKKLSEKASACRITGSAERIRR